MSAGQGITQELGLGDVISKSFELYRRDFKSYAILFLVVEAVTGILDTLVRRAIVVPAALPANETARQALNSLPGFFGAVIAVTALTALAGLVLYPLAYGGAVKMASDEILTGKADLAPSVRFAVSRIVWLWVVGLVVGIIVFLGLIAFVIPGIILGIMFALAVPVVVVEKVGLESLGRSRKLVGQRWLKTFALALVLGITVIVGAAVTGAIGGVFGVASSIVSGILSAFYLPLIPIAVTVYYYSNLARISPPQMGQSPQGPAAPRAAPQPGMKFCSSCGAQVSVSNTYCPSCGAKLPN